MKVLLSLLITTMLVVSSPLHAQTPKAEKPLAVYHYASNLGEYSVGLPEAPSVRTIWGNDKNIPYIGTTKSKLAMGEKAYFERSDHVTEEFFSILITTLKTKPAQFTEEKTRALLKRDYRGIILSGKNITHAVGANPKLRRTSLTGFAADKENNPLYYATHFLTGENTITILKIRYSLDNKLFSKYYKTALENISYLTK